MKNRSFYSILALFALLFASPTDSYADDEPFRTYEKNEGLAQEFPHDWPCLSLSYVDSMLKCSIVNLPSGQTALTGERLSNVIEFLENDRIIATYFQARTEYRDHVDRVYRAFTRPSIFSNRVLEPIVDSSTTVKNFYLRFSSMSKLSGNYTCQLSGGSPPIRSNSIELTNRVSNEIFSNMKSVSLEERCGTLIQALVEFDIDKDEYVDDDTFHKMTCRVSFNKPVNNYTVIFKHGANEIHTVHNTVSVGEELVSRHTVGHQVIFKPFNFSHKPSDDFSKEFYCVVQIHNGHPTSKIMTESKPKRIFPKVTVDKQTEVMVHENDTAEYKHKCVVNFHPIQTNIPKYNVKLVSANDDILGSKYQRSESVTVFDNIAETDGVYCKVLFTGTFKTYYSGKAAAERSELSRQMIQNALDLARSPGVLAVQIL